MEITKFKLELDVPEREDLLKILNEFNRFVEISKSKNIILSNNVEKINIDNLIDKIKNCQFEMAGTCHYSEYEENNEHF